MSREKVYYNAHCVLSVSIFFLFLLNLSCPVTCQDGKDFNSNPAAVQIFSDLVFSSFSSMTSTFNDDITKNFGFCITDSQADWNEAFNFSKNTQFLADCARKTKGDMTHRLCTAAEIKFYFNSFFGTGSKRTNYLKPNKNCNLTSWVPGCEPGWACSTRSDEKVDLKNSKDMPIRTLNCQACCEGFFCPHGITCMIPCPLGAYCPRAKLNKTTGVCDPYLYQLPHGQPNHTCGGADVWADVGSTSEVFCSAGSYCPSTIQKIPCSSGY